MSTNYTVSSDVDAMLKSANKAAIRSNIEAAFVDDVEYNTSDIASLSSSLTITNANVAANTSNIATNTSNISTNESLIQANTADIATNATNISANTTKIDQVDVAVGLRAFANAPQFTGPAFFRPAGYNTAVLVSIKKLENKAGARVGINLPVGPAAKCALHVAHNSSDGLPREALRVSGGANFQEWVKIGQYTDTERDAISQPTNGTIIYNKDYHEFQGYIGGGQGSASGWQKFNMSPASTS